MYMICYDATPMTSMQRFPVTIEPLRYAKTRREISGAMPLAQMLRLRALLAEVNGEVQVNMNFGLDEDKFVVVKLTVEARLQLQ